ncbi:MAG: 3-deoxy-D-manno-octulosonate 8-phosphate phosphatase [Bacteroidetes bacterium]|nr:MAG: 3-deoxy-D-manno-octulosonate 8-phosphate phosphatase [Bacteroidota bacterium]
MSNYKALLSQIDTFIFDVDGVMTDGIVLLTPDGQMHRSMNVKDGYALQLAVKKGYRIIIITGGNSEAVRQRFEGLGIREVYLAIGNKLELFHEIVKRDNLKMENILYMGDDIPDYEIMSEVGVAACPANAAEEIKHISKYISPLDGGKGCARDVLEQVMKVQDKWFDEDGFHW